VLRLRRIRFCPSLAVIKGPDEFEGWRETIAIKSDEDLMAEIKEGISTLKKKSKVYTLEELFE
jgi:antitoxin YefM